MANTDRVDKDLFKDAHYLGKPAADLDKIVSRRIGVLEHYPEFFDSNANLIEVGSGSGATITRLANRFKTAIGIDIYDYSVQYTQQQIKNGDNRSRFQKLDLENEPLPGRYDRLISFEVIEHFKSDDSISKFNELLAPGGLAAITVPNKWWIFETHGAKLPLLPWNRVPFFSWLPTAIHERYANARIYTRKRIVDLFTKHGFEVLDAVYVTAPMDVLKEGTLKNFLTANIFKGDTTKYPFLATSVFVYAKKK